MPREYAGGAKRTQLVGDITAASTTFTVTDATGWPTGATGAFAIAFELGVAGEEKVLVQSRSGNTLTVAAGGRGYDGTTAASHQSGANVDHVITAIDIREATSVTTTEGVAYDSARLGGVAAPLYSTTAQANAAYAAAGHTHGSSTKTVRLPHTWAISGEVKVPASDTDFIVPFFLPEPAGQTVRIVGARYRINSGTSVTAKLQLDGVDVAGLTGLSVTTTAATTDPADVDVTDAQMLALVVTAVAGTPKNMTFTVWLEYTV